LENINQTQVHHRVLIVQVVCINLVVEPLCVLNATPGNMVQLQVQQFVKIVLVERFQVLDKPPVLIVRQAIFKYKQAKAYVCPVFRVNSKIQMAQIFAKFVPLAHFPLQLHRHPVKVAVQVGLLPGAAPRVRGVAPVQSTRTWPIQMLKMPMNVKCA